MVKKKSRRKIIKAPVPKLDTVFNCPLCGHKKTVAVVFNKKENVGHLRCKGCNEEYTSKLRRADAYIDIYYRWVDELQKRRNKEEEEQEKSEEKYDDEKEEHNEESEGREENENESGNESHDEHEKHEQNDENEENEASEKEENEASEKDESSNKEEDN